MCDIPCMRNVKDNPTGEKHPCPWLVRKAADVPMTTKGQALAAKKKAEASTPVAEE